MSVKVKKLEWPTECRRGMRVTSKQTALVQYTIAHYGGDGSDETVYRWASEGGKWSEAFHTYEAAQGAAQGDYDDRVLSEVEAPAKDLLEPFQYAWDTAVRLLENRPASLGDMEALAKYHLMGGSIHRAALASREARS